MAPVLGRHDDRHLGPPGYRVAGPEVADAGRLVHPVAVAASLEGGRHRPPGRLDGVGLGVDHGGGRAGDGPPRVQRLGDVGDAFGALGQPQDQVVVLAAVEVLAQAPDLLDQGPPGHGQVAHVVVGGQLVRRPVRLDVRVVQLPCRVQLVLVGVQDVDGRVGVEPPHHLGQGVRLELVVVVQEGHVLPGGHGQCGVGGLGYARRGGAVDDHDAGVVPQGGQHVEGLAAVRAVVGHAQLPPVVHLRPHRFHGGRQDVGVGVVDRHQDADGRPIGEVLQLGGDGVEHRRAGTVPLVPQLVAGPLVGRQIPFQRVGGRDPGRPDLHDGRPEGPTAGTGAGQ